MLGTRSRIALPVVMVGTCAATLASVHAHGYPVLIRGQEAWQLHGAMRQNLLAIVPTANGGFKAIGIQFDEMEDDAVLVLRNPQVRLPFRASIPHPSDNDPFRGGMTKYHRIVMDDTEFTQCDAKCAEDARKFAEKTCPGGTTGTGLKVEIADDKRTAFIFECGKKTKPVGSSHVTANLKERKFVGPLYSYQYKGDKNILFEGIQLGGGGALSGSEMVAYLRPRFMFNVTLTEKDLLSQVSAVVAGNVATEAELTTEVDVVGIGSGRQVCCDMTFYRDAFYFPVVIQLPFSGNSFAKGSGMFFGLSMPAEIEKTLEYSIPNTSKASGSTAAVLTLTTGEQMLAIGFRGTRGREGGAVLPELVRPSDLEKLSFSPKVQSKIGFFYDIRKLDSGLRHFDVWFFTGKSSERERLIRLAGEGIKTRLSGL